MLAFTALYAALDATTRTGEKLEALERYFAAAPAEDAAWALVFLSGGKLSRAVPTPLLKQWTAEEAGLPHWLVDECQHAVGDFGEALALLHPGGGDGSAEPLPLHALVERRLLPLRELDELARREVVVASWRELGELERLVWNKLLTGSLRVGVSRTLVVRAVAGVAGLPAEVVARRLGGGFEPSAASWRALLAPPTGGEHDAARPYPFFLAHPLEREPAELGPVEAWLAEWKWDGFRAQLLRRGGAALLWSRGDEEVSARFPEIAAAAARLPDGTVLDGEVLAWRDGAPLPFLELQKRINKQRPGAKLLRDVPVVLMVYDLLEESGEDLRDLPTVERRARLERLLARADAPALILSPLVEGASWQELEQLRAGSRARGVEGLMLKRRDAPYGVGRVRGPWWKHKVEPYAIDAVLIQAQRGSGRRASLYTDYTFGLWSGGELVPFAKAYSGLSDAEIAEVDAVVRRTTVSRHGPVRVLQPTLVFELHFEALQESRRHRSGLAVRFPRMARWRRDKRPEDADTLDTLRALLRAPRREPAP